MVSYWIRKMVRVCPLGRSEVKIRVQSIRRLFWRICIEGCVGFDMVQSSQVLVSAAQEMDI